MDAKMKWATLTESNREKLIDKYRHTHVDYEWWDYIEDTLREDMNEAGVTVAQMNFRGFWSQGDGAEFAGYINDWEKFLRAVGKPELTPFAKEHFVRFSWGNVGRHYYGPHSIDFDVDKLWVDNPGDEGEDPVRYMAWEVLYGEGGAMYQNRESFIEYLRDKMKELYRDLEQEYEYLTGDEHVTEYLLEYEEEAIDALLQEQREEEEAEALQI